MKAISFFIGVFLGGFIAVALVLPAAHIELLYTRGGVGHLEDLRLRAIHGDISQAASNLKEVVEYWPAKVSHKGDMAQIYELARAGVIREIITRMRSLSGKDLGEDPKLWIEKFYRKETAQPNQSPA